LAARLAPKYRPAWEGRPPAEQAAMAWYFLPHRSAKPLLGPTRPRVLKGYCPFADQTRFASGHRYCINVYTGCVHGCVYCYAAGYSHMDAKAKADFRRLLGKDMADLDAFDVPPAPVHLSNSTDAFQPLEAELGHTRFALGEILRYRHRFTTVTVLTKNPMLAARDDYLDLLAALNASPVDGPALRVEVSLTFGREEAATMYDPGAPSVADRMEGIRRLRAAGLPVALRLAPLYPFVGVPASDPCPHTMTDIEQLVAFAHRTGVRKIVHTPGKIVRPKHGDMHPLMESMLKTYRRVAGSTPLVFRSGSWRLPTDAAMRCIVTPLAALCDTHGVHLAFCKHHLIGTT